MMLPGVLVVGRSPWDASEAGRRFSFKDLGTPVFADDDGVSVWQSRSEEGIFFLQKFAHRILPRALLAALPPNFILLPLQGIKDGIWCDGPIIRQAAGVVITFVPEGYPVELELPHPPKPMKPHLDELDGPKFLRGLVGSLITGMRYSLPCCPQATIPVTQFSLMTYVSWVLVKKAWPLMNVIPISSQNVKAWPAGAKRVCQNLGWHVYERDPHPDHPVLDLKPFLPAIAAWDNSLAQLLTERSAVIPGSLIKQSHSSQL